MTGKGKRLVASKWTPPVQYNPNPSTAGRLVAADRALLPGPGQVVADKEEDNTPMHSTLYIEWIR
jgi:hypothetical protein